MKRNAKTQRPSSVWRRLVSATFSLMLLIGIGGAAAFAISGIQNDAAAERAEILVDERAITVVTRTATLSDGYEVPRRYSGRTVISRQTDMAFEVGGRVIEAPARIGLAVEAGQVLGLLDASRLQSSLEEAQARLQRSQTTLDQARSDYERAQTLVDRGAITRQSAEQAETALMQAEQDVGAAREQVERLRLDIADASLIAPFDGIITSVDFELGDIVGAGTPVVRMIDPASIEGHVGLPVQAATALEVGQEVPLFWRSQETTAEISSIVPVVTSSSQTMLVVVTWPEAEAALAGEALSLAKSQFIEQDGFWVPLDALVSDLRGLFAVQVAVEQDGAFEVIRAPVQVHYSDGERAFVSGAIKEGDQIVTQGTNRVAPGQSVILAEAGAAE